MRSYNRLTQAVLRRPVELGLHPAVGVMDQLPRRGAARRQRHLQGGHRQGRPQVDFDRPADDAAAEGVQDHGEKANSSSSRRYVMSATQS